jgi:hypothetical protein
MKRLVNIVNDLMDLIIESVKYGVNIIMDKIEFLKFINEANQRERMEQEDYIWNGGVTNNPSGVDDENTKTPYDERSKEK